MLLDAYFTYLKNLAISHVDVNHNDSTNKHFIVAEIDELLDGLKGLDTGYTLAVEYPESRINEPFSDNKLDIKTCAINIIHPIKNNDFNNRLTIMSNCEAIVRQFIAKMNKDANALNSIVRLNLSEVNFLPIPKNVYVGFVGARAEFNIVASEPNNYFNSEKWA